MGDFADDLINGSQEEWKPKKTKEWADMTREEQDSCIGLGFPTLDSNSKAKSKIIYTAQVVDANMIVHWERDIEGALGTKHARDLWRVKFPDVRNKFKGKPGFMIRVKTRRE